MLRSLLARLLRKRSAAPAPPLEDSKALLDRAVALHRAGKLQEADAAYAQVLVANPEHGDAMHLRGLISLQREDPASALAYLRNACELAPRNALYLAHLGEALRLTDELGGALDVLETAVALDPAIASAWDSLGSACLALGMATEALAHFRRAIELKPGNPVFHSNLLFAMNLVPAITDAQLHAEHLRWGERHARPLAPASAAPHGPRPARRLRIGYVSPDFRFHALAPYIAPVLEHHDRSLFEVFAYSSVSRPDAMTASLRSFADHWRDISALDDESAQALVKSDGIDILVDLAGHTSGNRLLLFARKPAPMQVTMLGYPYGTGVAAIDYRVTDRVADANAEPGAGDREALLRLPDSLWCFRPWPTMPGISPLPAHVNGHVTFVSLNNPGKLNDEVLRTWAEILRRVPDARLRMMLIRPGRPRVQMMDRLAGLGFDVSRISTHERAPSAEFWRQAQASDIALDPFPCNGGATTCESLWLGLPVIALAGDRFGARASCSILNAAGLAHLACLTQEAYVERACELAANADSLAALRAGMRERLLGSALMNERRYVRALESLLATAWRQGAASGVETARD